MSNPSHEVRDALLTNNPLVAIIGSKLRPVSPEPSDNAPYVLYRSVTGVNQAYTQSDGGALNKHRWQFDCFATTHAGVETLAAALRVALRTSSLDAEVVNQMDADSDPELKTVPLWRYIVEAYTWHKEG